MNPVLLLTHNCIDLTRRCVDSLLAQDIHPYLVAVDNGSTDGTVEWLGEDLGHVEGECHILRANRGVSFGWNLALGILFRKPEVTHVLVTNNDTELPPWAYSELLSYDVPFVTGVAIDRRPTERPERMPLTPNPDFSCFLIRRDCWETVGPFDEEMVLYASDCDYHVRAHRLGVPLMKANVPYYHVNSQTLKRATPEERLWIQAQANRDRAVFQKRYGCLPGTKEYDALFTSR